MVLCWVARYTKSNCPSAKTENSTPPSIKIYAFPLYGVWFVDPGVSFLQHLLWLLLIAVEVMF